MGRLISGPEQILDVWQGERRVAAAVLLDKVSNPGRHACLEFIGIAADAEPASLIRLIFAQARERLGPAHVGIQLGKYQQGGLGEALLRELGCAPYYEMYDMVCATPGSHPQHRPDPRARELSNAEFWAYYELLCRAFAENPDTSISDYDTAREAFDRSSGRLWMIWDQDRPLAFVHLVLDAGSPEIRTLGVDPAARGRGLGKALLGHALAWLAQAQLAPCRLSVAVANARALALYQNMGFETVDQSACWLWRKPTTEPKAE